MKKALALVLLVSILIAGSCLAEEYSTLAPWGHEAGWTSFPLALQSDGLDAAWQKGAEVFAANMGIKKLDAGTLKSMMLSGYHMEPQFDHLLVEGNRVTVSSADGKELFSHEYAYADTVENAMEDTAVYVFKTEEAGAGAYTYLCLTMPAETVRETGSYTTFSVFFTKKDYKGLFQKDKVGLPCLMIRADTGADGLEAAILQIFAAPAVMTSL